MKNKKEIEPSIPAKKSLSKRRDFFKKAGLGVLGGLAASEILAKEYLKDPKPLNNTFEFDAGDVSDLLSGGFGNIKLKMQDDIRRALKKPAKERSWGMAIDLRKCVGCNACTVACVAENALPPGIVYRPIIKEEIGTYPNVSKINMPKPCMQCDNPPCTKVCPVGATFKNDEGIVEMDYEACIGCRYCMTACPYEHRMFDYGEYFTTDTPGIQPYDKRPSFEYSQGWTRSDGHSPVGNVRKCTFCHHRLKEGLLPQCVTTCIGGANYFGDLNDPDSIIAKVVSRPNVSVLKKEEGTKPKVFYIN
jgi:Fe-S-cluster-containing dehydrogenase component